MLSLTSQAGTQTAAASTTCTSPVLSGFKVPALVYVGSKLAVTIKLSCAPSSPGGGITTTVGEVTTNTPVTISATLGGLTLQATTVLLPPFGPGDQITVQPESGQGRHIYGQEFDLEYLAAIPP